MPVEQEVPITVVDRDGDGIVGQLLPFFERRNDRGQGNRFEIACNVGADCVDVRPVVLGEGVEYQDSELAPVAFTVRGKFTAFLQLSPNGARVLSKKLKSVPSSRSR